MIYVIGDSHVSVFSGAKKIVPFYDPRLNRWDETPYFTTCRIGPIIAYNVFNKINMFQSILDRLNKTNDIILFNYGEIDCRVHLPKRASDRGEDINFTIQDCVNRYADLLNRLSEWKIFFTGVHPTTWLESSKDMPIFGSEIHRNTITKIFNDKLQLKTNRVISIFDKLINEDMTTKREYYMDHLHLDGSKTIGLIIEEFKKQGLI